MLFVCFSLEHPELRVLNYVPGIVLTDMLQEAVEKTDFMNEDKQNISNFLKPEETANRLVEILILDKFKSGGRLSYADGLNEI